MSSLGVVLDACVLIPATLRDTLLRPAEKGMYRLHWSDRGTRICEIDPIIYSTPRTVVENID